MTNELKQQAAQMQRQFKIHGALRALVDSRESKTTYEAAGLTLDITKHWWDSSVLSSLQAFAQDKAIETQKIALQKGEPINKTEDRAVLHFALRHPQKADLCQDQVLLDQVHHELDRMEHCLEAVHQGRYLGCTGKPIKHLINIGIGGSYLGPKLAVDALKSHHLKGFSASFIANVDYRELDSVLEGLDLEETLVVISSKSFSTIETLMNTQSLVARFKKLTSDKETLKRHFWAITAKPQALIEAGIPISETFAIWDWVGGRYSVFSAIGLPIAFMIGMKGFRAFLQGAHEIDQHFFQTPLESNMPVMMGLLAYWYRVFWDVPTSAILGYHHGLRYFPEYCQQLDMESNGKSVTMEGKRVDVPTGAVIWGGEGTNGQHAYHQLLHQGTQWHPVDFIVPLLPEIDSNERAQAHQTELVANALAQSLALMMGVSLEESKEQLHQINQSEAQVAFLAQHKKMQGNRPSSLILMDRLTPETMGSLIALYEYRTIVMGWLWGINSFDQWGVELGKKMAKALVPYLKGQVDQADISFDSSTLSVIKRFNRKI